MNKKGSQMRIALGIEYDGSHFHGWQKQPDLRTVQDELEKALSKVANETIYTVSAGRTDTGVHAFGQVVHFETTADRSDRAWIFGGNSNLPNDISIRWSQVVDDQFHARFSALSRRYIYIIYNSRIRRSLFSHYLTWQYQDLDANKMDRAAKLLIGEHDFSSFRSVECQSSTPMRNVTSFNVQRFGEFIVLDVMANAFLHHMVRNFAGVLIAIGSGRYDVAWIEEVLAMKNRSFAAETAPAYGLYLAEAKYPDQYPFPPADHNFMLFGMPSATTVA